mgnify:CR=1 FL=1
MPDITNDALLFAIEADYVCGLYSLKACFAGECPLSLPPHAGEDSCLAAMANDAVAAFKSMAKRTVFFGRNLAADVETEAKTKFSATMRAAIVPAFEHLAAEKQITRRKLANGDFAYYDAPAIAKTFMSPPPRNSFLTSNLHTSDMA